MPPPDSSDADASDAQAAALERIASRLHDEFPHVDPIAISERLKREYEATDGARVQAFRLVLAERATRRCVSTPRRDPGGGI